jgi:hypothetical protein
LRGDAQRDTMGPYWRGPMIAINRAGAAALAAALTVSCGGGSDRSSSDT